MNIGYIVTRGTNKEVDRILINKEKKIDKVKKDVILAANRVLELQTQVESVKTKEEAKAEVKLFKLQKRVNTI